LENECNRRGMSGSYIAGGERGDMKKDGINNIEVGF
jgi:hypothetical protein